MLERASMFFTRQAATRSVMGLLIASAIVPLTRAPASAQQFPGLMVAQPSSPPPQAAPSAAPPPVAAKPKPKPKPKAVAAAADAAAGSSADVAVKGGGERIVMLVNDEPVTAREIEQRTRLLSASSNVGPKAMEIFMSERKRERDI